MVQFLETCPGPLTHQIMLWVLKIWEINKFILRVSRPDRSVVKSNIYFTLQTTSCYRSSGSVPIPRPSPLHFNSYVAPIKKKKKAPTPAPPEPTIKKVEVSNIENIDTEETTPILSISTETDIATLVDIENDLRNIQQVLSPIVLVCEPTETESVDKVPELPTKKPKDDAQSCRKHSRCHCHLFSKETDGFFSVPAAPIKWTKPVQISSHM